MDVSSFPSMCGCSGTSSPVESLCLTVEDLPGSFPKHLGRLAFPLTVCEFLISPQYCQFFFSAFLRAMVVVLKHYVIVVLSCIFPKANDVEEFFMCYLSIAQLSFRSLFIVSNEVF